jgi:hypothetical protein
MPVASDDEILRCAQDDSDAAHTRPATKVSATKVLPGGLRPPAMAKWGAETAEMGAALRTGRADQPAEPKAKF